MAQTEVRPLEIEERMRQIAREVIAEQADVLRKEIMEGELGKLRRELDAHFRRVWEAIQALAEAQKRTEERVNELAEAQKRTEERLERLEATVQALAEAQKRTEERLNELAEAQRRTEETIARLDRQLAETNKQVG
ncbi:MAG: hypothetical protein ACP5NB_05630, partial [Chloroflexia bacterium]